MISVLIPANNEEDYIGVCLEALLAQETGRSIEVIVAANACTDTTLDIARSYEDRFAKKGWAFRTLDIKEGGKPNALNRADAVARGDMRVYLDADVVMSKPLLEQLAQVLDQDMPTYASGRLIVAPTKNWVTRAYGRIWTHLPFMTHGVPGAGLFAVNAAGRARWNEFPNIISDDTYVRLQFAPHERIGVEAEYEWPLVEGLPALTRVRSRQDHGVAEVARLWPEAMKNEGKRPLASTKIAMIGLRDPLGLVIYTMVSLLVRISRDKGWSRGR